MARPEVVSAVAKSIATLLHGGLPDPVDSPADVEGDEAVLLGATNLLASFMAEIQRFIVPLSQGELHKVRFARANHLASPFKELHSRLCQLTWQAKQVAQGDYGQRVDFMGDFSTAFNAMVEALARNEAALREKIAELEDAVSHMHRLEGLLPICAGCKRIRRTGADPHNQEAWEPVESYIQARSEATFSHGLCPACLRALYPEIYKTEG